MSTSPPKHSFLSTNSRGTLVDILSPQEQEKLENSKSDRGLKVEYAKHFKCFLGAQVVFMNVIFILVGMGYLTYSEWTIDIFMTGTLIEIFGVIFVITKNLFPKTD